MTRKIRVLQLQLRYNVSTSDLAEQVIEGLPPDRFAVTTAFLRGEPGPGEPESRARRSIYFRFRQSDLKGLKRFIALWRVYKHCRESSYDVVIAHRFKPTNMLMLMNRLLRIPACIGVQHSIGDYDRPYRRWEVRHLLTPNWRIVAVSRAVRQYLLDCRAGFVSRNTVQINNAIDIDRAERLQHSRERAREALGLEHGKFVFGTIGRLVPVKGHVNLIEAFAMLQADHPEVDVVIIGEGRMRAQLEATIERHGLQGRVHLPGAREDALQYVRAFDAFLMPSVSEGLPLALLEGMSGHLPVIGSDIDSLRPILEDCGGRVFPVGDSLALSQQMRAVLALDDDQRRAEGERAYAYLRSAHAIEDFRYQYRKLIEDLIRVPQ